MTQLTFCSSSFASLRKVRVPQPGNKPTSSSPPVLVTGHPALAPRYPPPRSTVSTRTRQKPEPADVFCLAEHKVSKESQLVANFEKSVDFT